MENKPGNAKDSPFGNGEGATSAGPATSAGDANAPKNRPQENGGDATLCAESIPSGGTLPFKGPPVAVEHKPFKLNGG